METGSRLVVTFLMNALWQAALLAAMAWAADRILRRGPASYRHAVWAAAMIGSVLLPLMSVVPRPPGPAAYVAPPPDLSVAAPPAGPMAAPAAPVSPGRRSIPLAPTAAGVIAAGYAMLLLYGWLRLGASLAATQRMGAAGTGRYGDELARAWERAREAMTPGATRLRVLPGLVSPIALHRTVIVPTWFDGGAGPEVLASALGHELAHVARRDFAFNLLYEACFALVAFHPAAWLMRREIERTREMACDEAVTRRLVEPGAYAKSILEIATAAAATAEPRLALGVSDGNLLGERIRRVLARPGLGLRRPGLALGGALAGLAIAAGAAPPGGGGAPGSPPGGPRGPGGGAPRAPARAPPP
ncbi:MAG TPA: hypothetical protein DEH78_17175, partial [Solibacterales bacterium]|nr:hypothetical protein [Bryobacterales bacterium]